MSALLTNVAGPCVYIYHADCRSSRLVLTVLGMYTTSHKHLSLRRPRQLIIAPLTNSLDLLDSCQSWCAGHAKQNKFRGIAKDEGRPGTVINVLVDAVKASVAITLGV